MNCRAGQRYGGYHSAQRLLQGMHLSDTWAGFKGQARQVALEKPRVSRRRLTASTRLTGYQREVTLLPATTPGHANLQSRADHILNVCPIHRSPACRHPKNSSPALRKAVLVLRYGHITTTVSTAVLSQLLSTMMLPLLMISWIC